jgi:hypothetical protein
MVTIRALVLMELPILVAVAAVGLEEALAATAVQAWSSFPFQHHDTQAQPQAHQQSPQVVQTQF